MTSQESRRHHFVPEFLLKPWAVEGVLNGFWWDHREGRLSCRRKGARAFCYGSHLLSVKRHEAGRDVLEREFFSAIDTKGAVARDRLLVEGSASLDVDQRCDFARLLLSLEARRPVVVHRLREEGSRFLANSLDSDPEILDAMEREGLSESPSQWFEQQRGLLEDRALVTIQRLVDHPDIGETLINRHWSVVRTSCRDDSVVLSDRPLVRVHGYDHPDAAWFLPLNPRTIFCAANPKSSLHDLPPKRFVSKLNVASAEQAERFVFSVDGAHQRWLGKYLRRNSAQ